MVTTKSKRASGIGFILRKYFLSAFVTFSFIAYAIHERALITIAANVMAPTIQPTVRLVPTPTTATNGALGNGEPPLDPPATNTIAPQPTDVPPTDIPPTAVPPTVVSSMYRDGTYQGDVADAFYGNVQVQATIQGGQITDVQFLDYPHDRRTSQRINQYATPYLQQEAIQVQNANVDLISGATLTSEAFVQSLQSALSKARS